MGERVWLVVNHWVRVEAGLCSVSKTRLSERSRRRTKQTECVSICKHSECVFHKLNQLEDFSWWCVFVHQDVGCSSCFLLLLQTPGGPHQEGKLHDTHNCELNLPFQQQWFSALKRLTWICPRAATDKILWDWQRLLYYIQPEMRTLLIDGICN